MAWPRSTSSAARHPGCRKAEHAEIDARVPAGVVVVHGELYSDAGAGIDRSAALQRDVGAAAAFRRRGNCNLGDEFGRLQRRGVGVEDEIVNIDAALAARARASSLSRRWPAARAPNRQWDRLRQSIRRWSPCGAPADRQCRRRNREEWECVPPVGRGGDFGMARHGAQIEANRCCECRRFRE